MCWQHVYEKGVLFLIIISGCLLPIRLLTSPMITYQSLRLPKAQLLSIKHVTGHDDVTLSRLS